MSPAERPITPAWLRGIGLVGVATVLTLYAWWTMIANYPKTPEEDGRYVYQQFEIAKASIRIYGEAPLWNPFDCRGIPMWDHPESMTASPIVWLTAYMSTGITIILWNVLHVIAGWVGMWLLVRQELKLGRPAAFVGATMFGLGVAHVTQYAGEHETFVCFLFAPILILLWRRAETSVNAAIGLGALLAFMVYEGATYPLPYCGMMLVIETVTRLTSKQRALAILKAGAIVGVFAFLLSAARLLPLVDQMQSHKRTMSGGPDVDAISLKTLNAMYTLRSPHWRAHLDGQQYVFGEYLSYIGWLAVILLVIGVAVGGAEYAWLLFLAIALGALMMGHFHKYAPWTLLHEHVPPFKSMRVASRFRLPEMMCIGAFVAIAIDRTPKRLRAIGLSPRLTDAIGVVLLGLGLVAAGDAIGLDQEIMSYRFNGAPAQPVQRSTRFHYGGPGLAHDFIDQPRQNRAWLGCRSYEWPALTDAPLWQGDVPQAKAVDDGAVVEVANRTHNTFTIDVVASRPSRIMLNSAYERSWQSSVGTVVNHEKLLGIDLPEGRHRVKVRYWPRTLTPGILLSCLGVVLIGGYYALQLRRRSRSD